MDLAGSGFLLIFLVAVALAFDFLNGLHDAANSIATIVSTRVLPARYDDNYFWLLPGETRRVTVSWPGRLGHSRGVRVSAEAYNAARVTT